MKIESSITSPGDPLSDWLKEKMFNDGQPIRFREFHRRLIRLLIIPEVTVLKRGVAEVVWGEDEPPNDVILTGLTDAQMLRLCCDSAMLMCKGGDDRIDENELARLGMLRSLRQTDATQN